MSIPQRLGAVPAVPKLPAPTTEGVESDYSDDDEVKNGMLCLQVLEKPKTARGVEEYGPTPPPRPAPVDKPHTRRASIEHAAPRRTVAPPPWSPSPAEDDCEDVFPLRPVSGQAPEERETLFARTLFSTRASPSRPTPPSRILRRNGDVLELDDFAAEGERNTVIVSRDQASFQLP